MKLRLVCVGKVSEPWLRQGIEAYGERVARYLPLQTIELKEEKGTVKKGQERQVRAGEGERLLQKVPTGAFVVSLDERGSQLSSEALAAFLEKHMVSGTAELVWMVGGAYGLSDAVRTRADLLLSLSAMTLPHQMVRLVLFEQLYRALTIVRNEPYHNR